MNVDLPEPDGPTRNTNSPLSICSETSSQADHVGLVDLGDPVEDDHRRAAARGRPAAAVRPPRGSGAGSLTATAGGGRRRSDGLAES